MDILEELGLDHNLYSALFLINPDYNVELCQYFIDEDIAVESRDIHGYTIFFGKRWNKTGYGFELHYNPVPRQRYPNDPSLYYSYYTYWNSGLFSGVLGTYRKYVNGIAVAGTTTNISWFIRDGFMYQSDNVRTITRHRNLRAVYKSGHSITIVNPDNRAGEHFNCKDVELISIENNRLIVFGNVKHSGNIPKSDYRYGAEYEIFNTCTWVRWYRTNKNPKYSVKIIKEKSMEYPDMKIIDYYPSEMPSTYEIIMWCKEISELNY